MNSKRHNIIPKKQPIPVNSTADLSAYETYGPNLPILPQGPAVTITETDEALIVTVPLPGIRINEVVVEVIARKLTIKGHRQHNAPTAPQQLNEEKDVCTFFQSVKLSDTVNVRNVSSTLINEILTVTFFKVQNSAAAYHEEDM